MKFLSIFLIFLLNVSLFSQTEEQRKLELEVTALKTQKSVADASANIVVIDSDTLRQSSGEGITDVLREHGIIAEDGIGSRKEGDNVYIQGLSSSRLLIVIDGVRVRDGIMGNISALKRIPISSIEKIEVIKGPSSYLWGSDAMAGVIYIYSNEKR